MKPMLATDADLEKLVFPLLASAKLDGVRAIIQGGVVLSRSLKPIPNKFVQRAFGHLEHLDGELIVGAPTSKTCYRDTVSHVMSHDKEDYDLRFYVFDHVETPSERYQNRLVKVNHRIDKALFANCAVLTHPQHVVTCLCTLLELEEKMLDKGYEGLILRSPDAPYKFGRSTVKEGYLLKLKRMATDEAEIIGFIEQFHNGNEATTNELGHTQRSSHKENKTGKDTLGAVSVRWGDIEFEIGTGFSDIERKEIWGNQPKFLGKLVSFNHFPIGVKDKPRHPSFKGFRDSCDL